MHQTSPELETKNPKREKDSREIERERETEVLEDFSLEGEREREGWGFM